MSEEQNLQSTSSGLPQIKTVASGRGVAWISESWALFRKSPLIWIVNFIILMAILIALSVIPFVNLLVNLLSPVFAAGLILGARELDRGGELQVSHLFAGFSSRSGALIGLGAVYLILMMVVVFIGMGLMMGGMGAGMDSFGAEPDPAQMAGASMLGLLVMMALLIPVIMLYWFAPALLILNPDIGVADAMKLSFSGCVKNMMPFLLYGIVVMLLSIVAIIPFGLGLLILMPMIFISIYTAYKDIYLSS